MSTLDIQIMKSIETLPDSIKQPVLDLILSLQDLFRSDSVGVTQSADNTSGRRKLGIAKGKKFLADGYDFDSCNDEVAQLFGVEE